jgi:hypothetical protein
MRKKNLLIALFAILLNTSCWPTKDLNHFTLYGETNHATIHNLNIKGIYYNIQRKESNRFWNYDHVRCIVFYNNGTFLDLHSTEVKSNVSNAIDDMLKNFERNKERYSEHISFWGAYRILQDTIQIQSYDTWVKPKGAPITYAAKVVNHEMKIVNDTTLVDVGEANLGQEKYYLFKAHKPDSTNLFMTNSRIKKKLARLYRARHQ